MSKISRKLARKADDLCRTGLKVYQYRRDLLPEAQAQELIATVHEVDALKADKDTSEETLQAAVDKLDGLLRKTGGRFYPKSAMVENVEMLLVAAILAIGVRTFFIQPFRIPTNSMYPTYNGMTYEVYETPEEQPSVLMRPVRTVLFGASHHEVEAPVSGEVIIPVRRNSLARHGFYVPGHLVHARKWFGLMPDVKAEYEVLVDGTPVAIQVPRDFSLDKVLFERFGVPHQDQLAYGPNGILLFRTGVHVDEGKNLLAFDILLGDQLFVDRFSYHFMEPKVGQPIVFRTDDVPGMTESERGKYYIKRLVGKGGDSLQVKFPVLYRNGAPIKGAEAFELNAEQLGEYEGYQPRVAPDDLAPLEYPFNVPAESYFAMGDNSDESSDSRHWGVVPEGAIIGRALVIYYPFTKHFGRAK